MKYTGCGVKNASTPMKAASSIVADCCTTKFCTIISEVARINVMNMNISIVSASVERATSEYELRFYAKTIQPIFGRKKWWKGGTWDPEETG